MTVCFADPHFVVALPEMVYIVGGNILEFDYFIFENFGGAVRPAAYEDTTSPDEPFKKTPRYLHALRRSIPIYFAKGKAEPGGTAFATASARRSVKELTGAPDEVLEGYREKVGRLYTYFPDNAHVNYFVLTASPEYTAELAEDLAAAGEALKDRYPFLGYYLKAKGEAMMGRCPTQIFALAVKSEEPCFPRALRAPRDEAAVFMQQIREVEELEALGALTIYGLLQGEATVLESHGSSKRPMVERIHTVFSTSNWEKLPHELVKPWVVVYGDFNKTALDAYIDKAMDKHGHVCVVYVPLYVFVYESGKAPTTKYLRAPDDDAVKKAKQDLFGGREPEQFKYVWEQGEGRSGKSFAELPDSAPPYLFEI